MKFYRRAVMACILPLVFLTGCVSIPKSIQGNSPVPQQDFVRVMSAPALYIGQESRFGGKVIHVTNRDNLTRVELLVQPLDEDARPILGSSSLGRLYADIPSFVDPAELTNQYVTVLGFIQRVEPGKIDQQRYSFLVINVTGYQRWHLTQQVMSPPMPIDPWVGYGPRYGRRGFIDPWWGYSMPGPMPVQTFLSE
ncbi:Slp family lipoprotein [Rosenbergiella australiborealis]|uniref:Slp family lipoprotein n=1 Tax=Rosenbergiella australiborealis TaxID=1544696 RepID=A0ABS5T1S0_9GAMM|nr:Slp family lipoprotein [Rosenbergiella australiborealis]MBT0726299.1 Slp family lipoprotein [Rosenbergiella australiborealis]